jgi:hypothetical protein
MSAPSYGTLCGNCGRDYTLHDQANGKTWATVIDWRTDRLCPSCFASFTWSDQDWLCDDMNRVYRRKSSDDQAWRDAYYIATVGASNPKGVANALARHVGHLGDDHPAVRAIRGHLEFLQGTSLGPEFDDLREVGRNAARLGLIDGQFRSEANAGF